MSDIKWRVSAMSVAMRICSMWVDVLVLRLLTLALARSLALLYGPKTNTKDTSPTAATSDPGSTGGDAFTSSPHSSS